MTIASIGMKVFETMSNVNAQNKYAEQMAKNARDAALADYAALNTRQMEVDTETAIKQTERQRQAMREQSMANVAAVEAGVSGNTPMRQLADALIQGGYDTSIMETQQEIASRQILNDKFAVHARAEGRMNEAKANVVSPFEGLLKLTGSVFSGLASGMDTGDKLKKKRFVYG
jgi:hypothetical protein